MNEIIKRAIFGGIYVTILWACTSLSPISFGLLFFLLGIVALYEMWKLRKGKSKIMAFVYVILPFTLIQLLPYSNGNTYSLESFDPSIILLLFILTWTFDTFAFLTGIKLGKNKILPSVSPKKSWEGFIGGLIFCTIAGWIAYDFFSNFISSNPNSNFLGFRNRLYG